MAFDKMRMWMKLKISCYRLLTWYCLASLATVAALMSLHYALIPGNSFAQYITNDTLDHRSRRLQRQVDLKNQSLPHGDEITSEHGPDKQYELAKTFPPLHGDEWHVFRDNVQKLGELGTDDFVTLKAKARSVEYCNPSSYPVKGTEGTVPKGFHLEQVQVVIRHGQRSPMNRLRSNKTHISCLLNKKTAPNSRVASFAVTMRQLKSKLPLDGRPYNFGLLPSDGTCRGAQLTPEGSIQLLVQGEYLRTIYIDKWGLLPENYTSDDIYFRTTTYSRTFQSGIAFMYGFLNEIDMDILRPKFTETMNMYIQYCEILNGLAKTALKQTSKYKRSSDTYLSAINDLEAVFNMSQDKIPGIHAMLDGLTPYMCGTAGLPCMRDDTTSCITWPLIGKLWDFLDENGRLMLNNYANVKKHRLSMNPLLRAIARRTLQFFANNDTERFILYSGHDHTVSPLVTALGVHDGKWPPFASRVVFELYSLSDSSSEHFIRVLYNGADVTARTLFCRNKKLNMGLCPLDYFTQFALEDNLKTYGSSDYKRVCKRKTSNTSAEFSLVGMGNSTSLLFNASLQNEH